MNTINYEEEYYRLIKFYQDHPISRKDQYCEKHHIIPRSCGGSNENSNLVNLPADIHYKVHCYLPFIYKNHGLINEYHKMLYAWKRMTNSSNERLILFNIDQNAREYLSLKEAYSKVASINTMGLNNPMHDKHHSDETKEQLSKTHSGSKNSQYGKHWYYNPETKEEHSFFDNDIIPEGWIKGRLCLCLKGKASPTKGKVLIEDQSGTKIYVDPSKLDEYLANGYTKAKTEFTEEQRKIIGEKRKIAHQQQKQKLNEIKYNELKPMYDVFITDGFEEVVKRFNYQHTKNNLIMAFKKYIPEYIPTKCNRWKK